ncbi:unnamed protein product [Albugo candida]|uniref:BZIP domain-containing protein n=1 Tax=Albugo candida TaxID=65357 RepID=A0A024GC19_9STRA|nr:unnamed protein product [Albugo candida]|eukprot:CCI44229.1 unnamed protein product [Albugo candida]
MGLDCERVALYLPPLRSLKDHLSSAMHTPPLSPTDPSEKIVSSPRKYISSKTKTMYRDANQFSSFHAQRHSRPIRIDDVDECKNGYIASIDEQSYLMQKMQNSFHFSYTKNPVASDEKLRINRERNRLHAQRTRTRKRELLQQLKERIHELQSEHRFLSQAYEVHVIAACLVRIATSSPSRRERCERTIRKDLDTSEFVHANYMEDDSKLFDLSQILSKLEARDDSTDYTEPMDLKIDMETEDDVNSITTPTNFMFESNLHTKEDKEQVRRERNRIHARRARLRKKLMLEKSQQTVEKLTAAIHLEKKQLQNLLSVISKS